MFGKDIGGILVFESLAISHGARDFGHNPPVGLGIALGLSERALARYAPFGIGDRARFFRPPGGGQFDMGMAQCVGVIDDVGCNHQRATRQGKMHPIRIRKADCRVGCHDPDGFDFAGFNGAEHINRLVSFARFKGIGFPEPSDAINIDRIIGVHMGGKLIGKAANFASAHGVGLAGDGKRA